MSNGGADALGDPDIRLRLANQLASYIAFPPFQGETEIQSRLKGSWQQATTTLARMAGHLNGARCEAVPDDLVHLNDQLSETGLLLDSVISLNATIAQQATVDIEQTHDREWRLSILFAGVALAIVLLSGAALFRAGRRTFARLQEWGRQEQARAAELEEFGARVVHDLRTPMTALQLSLEIMVYEASDGDRKRTDGALQCVRTLNRLLRDLFQFSRAGARPVPGARADVHEVISQVAASLTPTHPQALISLPARDRGATCEVPCAPGLLTSVVSNLLTNSLKHGGDAPHIQIRVVPGNIVRVEVEDNGPGLRPGEDAQIFGAYVRGTKANGPASGSDWRR